MTIAGDGQQAAAVGVIRSGMLADDARLRACRAAACTESRNSDAGDVERGHRRRAPSGRMRAAAIGKATISAARNARNRGGAIILPMVRGFAMAASVTKRLAVVQ